jgi:hypothetical protein
MILTRLMLRGLLWGRAALIAENAMLRHQIAVL